MTEKTKEEIHKVLNECYVQFSNTAVASKIISLVEAERAKEVVLVNGFEFLQSGGFGTTAIFSLTYPEILCGKIGKLIFIPDEEAK